MIPKKIHYIWFGNKDFGPKEKYCMESWHKLLPDYEIIRWDDSKLDFFDNPYFNQAMENKAYAYASDYARLKVLEEFGGIYMDTDEEVLKSLDEFLAHDYFMGCQSCGSAKGLNPALIGAVAHHPIVKDLLAVYDEVRFINEDGSINKTTNPAYFGQVLVGKYNIPTTYLKKGCIEFYPNSFLYDYFYFGKKNKTSYATHHYAGNWKPDWKVEDKLKLKFRGNMYILRKYKRHREDADMAFATGEIPILKLKTSKKSYFILIKIKE